MIQVQEWLTRTDTELEQIQKLFQDIIDKTNNPDIAKKLHDYHAKIEKDYIPHGQKLRETWKDKNKTTYRDIKIHLDKLHFASLAISTISSLLG